MGIWINEMKQMIDTQTDRQFINYILSFCTCYLSCVSRLVNVLCVPYKYHCADYSLNRLHCTSQAEELFGKSILETDTSIATSGYTTELQRWAHIKPANPARLTELLTFTTASNWFCCNRPVCFHNNINLICALSLLNQNVTLTSTRTKSINTSKKIR